MTEDEAAIRALIERWATAAHEGDLEAVLAHHDDEIVMYDVPPPEDGVRGLEAYRETWPGFLQWQRNATFDILLLDVVAGQEVAFAYGLLLCGTPEESKHSPTAAYA
jgi:ketosteroid isomerase-like protein